jgi:hypothetical protein
MEQKNPFSEQVCLLVNLLPQVGDFVQAESGYVKMHLLSFEDLYAGKLCTTPWLRCPNDAHDFSRLVARAAKADTVPEYGAQ